MAKNIWLKVSEGIKGEGTHEGFKDQIQIESYSFGASNPIAGSRQHSGPVRGQVSVRDFTVTANLGLHSNPLFKALVTTQKIKEVVMTKLAGADSPKPFLIVTMNDCIVSHFDSSDHAGGDNQGVEQISFNYGKINVKYVQIGSDNQVKGNNEVTYDATTSKTT